MGHPQDKARVFAVVKVPEAAVIKPKQEAVKLTKTPEPTPAVAVKLPDLVVASKVAVPPQPVAKPVEQPKPELSQQKPADQLLKVTKTPAIAAEKPAPVVLETKPIVELGPSRAEVDAQVDKTKKEWQKQLTEDATKFEAQVKQIKDQF